MSSFMDKNRICISNDIIQLAHGNAKCNQIGSRGGAGGYISGIIKLTHRITAFATIGGRGIYNITDTYTTYDTSKMIRGGYGGGGSAFNYYTSSTDHGSGSCGGQTAVKFLSNDIWHRVIVSGAGGGSDNKLTYPDLRDDGSGGSGGGLTAQGYWIDGILNSDKVANSTFGFTFGSGESAQESSSKNSDGVSVSYGAPDRPGAGSGWFGGFAGHHGNGGAGGGSSWALSLDASIPKGNISAKGSFYNESESHPYAFNLNDGYIFKDVMSFPGVWEGNGRLVITILESLFFQSCICIMRNHFLYELLFAIFIGSS
ncbi:gp13, putative [Trichomonas vaginalis G3]|uniref:receptor protein-tyrosine kinase n=1 Tax=Trichomonas vaginalis (strain ATCC PRA-98 / G3) TaxID=412133 RepID=A2DX38_TRIV3|nr:glycine-rich protein family [Trichomonas vaginalis G3]EAY15065.1 gp13, putative [Trichomonas vaginalis G3]KAI5549631.1 glycine-rich protein family [Trichomonas vaginalis G3]|eukprot:XP_001327288.1 gp13 [Trichomonas vaginalis G3]